MPRRAPVGLALRNTMRRRSALVRPARERRRADSPETRPSVSKNVFRRTARCAARFERGVALVRFLEPHLLGLFFRQRLQAFEKLLGKARAIGGGQLEQFGFELGDVHEKKSSAEAREEHVATARSADASSLEPTRALALQWHPLGVKGSFVDL